MIDLTPSVARIKQPPKPKGGGITIIFHLPTNFTIEWVESRTSPDADCLCKDLNEAKVHIEIIPNSSLANKRPLMSPLDELMPWGSNQAMSIPRSTV